jgi:hypothetical protein
MRGERRWSALLLSFALAVASHAGCADASPATGVRQAEKSPVTAQSHAVQFTLAQAIAHGDVAAVAKYARADTVNNAPEREHARLTPLFLAVSRIQHDPNINVKMVELLLDRGADPNGLSYVDDIAVSAMDFVSWTVEMYARNDMGPKAMNPFLKMRILMREAGGHSDEAGMGRVSNLLVHQMAKK